MCDFARAGSQTAGDRRTLDDEHSDDEDVFRHSAWRGQRKWMGFATLAARDKLKRLEPPL